MAGATAVSDGEAATVGRLLQHWRRLRGKSQIALALQAGISARHLGFLEIGRANPSREMVVLLAGVLDVPLRERNGLLLAAGYAPIYAETGLDAPAMTQARKAVALILDHQEPYPAVVMDRRWVSIATGYSIRGVVIFLTISSRSSESPTITKRSLNCWASWLR